MNGLKFVRLEGYFEDQAIEQIQALLGRIGTEATTLDVQSIRDKDNSGILLESLPGAGKVVTQRIIFEFSQRTPGVTNLNIAHNRSSALFGALRAHTLSHEYSDRCSCSLRGGRELINEFTSHYVDYIDPASLIEAFNSGELDGLPASGSRFVKSRKTFAETVAYPILSAYVSALTE